MGQETYVGGTPLNERLQAFMLAKDDFCSVTADSLFEEQFPLFINNKQRKTRTARL